MTLHMVQLHPEPSALLRFLAGHGLNRAADADLGYGVHAWLMATFGDLAPRPFRLHADPDRGRPAKLLAYSRHGREALLDHALTFAEPAARAVCRLDDGLSVAAMPAAEHWCSGRRLGFEILACPVARGARRKGERDVFLHCADQSPPDAGLQREPVYAAWLAERLGEAADIERVGLDSFRLVPQWRRTARQGSRRGAARLTRPAALLRGTLCVRDGAAFHDRLSRGVGRHRAFGYGMLLLRPV